MPLEPSPLTRSALGPDFTLGVATSSYQIEGAAQQDGRGPSIWDTFCHTPGKTARGDTGDVACDHYHRYRDDIALMAWLGVDAYRFSVAWSRVLPSGRGPANPAGLDFYERLVDGLLEHGIKPCVTLYHWDLPQGLEDQGGWLARDTAAAFADYAALMARRLGDRVSLWLTHNEPWCQAFNGYELGRYAPGKRSVSEALQCAHHLLLSHGKAVQALRAEVAAPVGIAPNFMPAHPARDTPEDHAAAARLDAQFNRWFIEPALGLGYPRDLVQWYGPRMPEVTAEDLATIAEPIDVVGVNYYERAVVRAAPGEGSLHLQRDLGSGPRTADREIYPEGLREILDYLVQDCGAKRLVITENGAASPENEAPSEGRVSDPVRTQFLQRHLQEVARARAEGVPVDGFYAWSLMDNFEWAKGYTVRYGIVHVDFETQKRVPKESAHFLRSLSQRAALPGSFPSSGIEARRNATGEGQMG